MNYSHHYDDRDENFKNRNFQENSGKLRFLKSYTISCSFEDYIDFRQMCSHLIPEIYHEDINYINKTLSFSIRARNADSRENLDRLFLNVINQRVNANTSDGTASTKALASRGTLGEKTGLVTWTGDTHKNRSSKSKRSKFPSLNPPSIEETISFMTNPLLWIFIVIFIALIARFGLNITPTKNQPLPYDELPPAPTNEPIQPNNELPPAPTNEPIETNPNESGGL